MSSLDQLSRSLADLIQVVRRRLGHASTETTQVYALLADKAADTEIRAARRKREIGRR